jgi:hypothetical protein
VIEMTSETELEQYRKSLNALSIPRNRDPFPFDPPSQVDYWADNKKILQSIVQAQIDSVMFASSQIYVLYGPVGGGKTFAVRYLANSRTQKLILRNLNKTEFESFSTRIVSTTPLRTGQLTFALHRGIVHNSLEAIVKDDGLIRIFSQAKDIGSGPVRAAFENIRKAMRTRPLEGSIMRYVENTDGYKFLTQGKSSLGKLQDQNDLVEIVRILVQVLSSKYNRVVLSIDELENLRRATATERVFFSEFMRKMHETIEHDLTVFMIFTLESFEDVTALLQTALRSRVKDFIEFSFVKDKEDVKEYITECISQRCRVEPYSIIDEAVVDAIASALMANFAGKLSFRQINIEMHRVFTNTYLSAKEHPYKITYSLYEKAIKIVSAAEVVKKIAQQLSKKGDEK